MTPDFLAAVIDTLLPGDEVLPAGTRAGLDPVAYVASHRAAFDAIAAEARSVGSFVEADGPTRTKTLKSVEDSMPEAFRMLVATVLADYYESAPVLAAIGWRLNPPQPRGHELRQFGTDTTSRLEKVELRTKLWRA